MLLQEFPMHKTNLDLLIAIQDFLGFKIPFEPQDEADSSWSKGSVSPNFENKTWTFRFRMDSLNNNLICHELLHLVLWIHGWPYIKMIPGLDRQKMGVINSYPQHMVIGDMSKRLGFDPTQEDTLSVKKRIQEIEDDSCTNRRSKTQIRMDAAMLLGRFISCAEIKAKNDLRKIALEKIPDSLQIADSLNKLLDELLPLNSRNCMEAHHLLYDLFDVPRIITNTIFSEKQDSSFFESFQK